MKKHLLVWAEGDIFETHCGLNQFNSSIELENTTKNIKECDCKNCIRSYKSWHSPKYTWGNVKYEDEL